MPNPTVPDTSFTQSGVATSRLWFVDNLRVLLIALVILHHVACIYSGIPAWYYNEEPTSDAVGLGLSVFLVLNQAWFMGAFFLLSGYFSPASYDRKGPRAFVRDRLIRLGIPLLVFYFVLNPILYVGVYHATSPLDFSVHTVGTGPLWFVFALLLMDTSYAVFRRATGARARSPKPLTFRAVIAFVLALALVTYVWRIVSPAGLFVPIVGFPTADYLPQYVSFFVIGTVAYRRAWLQSVSARLGNVGLGLAIGATVVFLPLGLAGGEVAWTGHGTVNSLFFALWDSTFAVGLVLWLLTFFRGRFNTQGPIRRYLSTHVFTVYVTHAFVVTAAAHALSVLDIPSLAKVAIGAVVVLPACFLLAGPIRRIPGVRRVL